MARREAKVSYQQVSPLADDDSYGQSSANSAYPDLLPVSFSHSVLPLTSRVHRQVGMPVGCTVSPFIMNASKRSKKSKMAENVDNFAYHATGFARCEGCAAYINAYCDTTSQRWFCSLCGTRNSVQRSQSRYRQVDARVLPEMEDYLVELRMPMCDADGVPLPSAIPQRLSQTASPTPSASTSSPRSGPRLFLSAAERPLVHVFLVQESMRVDTIEACVEAITAATQALHPDVHVLLVTFSHRIGIYCLEGTEAEADDTENNRKIGANSPAAATVTATPKEAYGTANSSSYSSKRLKKALRPQFHHFFPAYTPHTPSSSSSTTGGSAYAGPTRTEISSTSTTATISVRNELLSGRSPRAFHSGSVYLGANRYAHEPAPAPITLEAASFGGEEREENEGMGMGMEMEMEVHIEDVALDVPLSRCVDFLSASQPVGKCRGALTDALSTVFDSFSSLSSRDADDELLSKGMLGPTLRAFEEWVSNPHTPHSERGSGRRRAGGAPAETSSSSQIEREDTARGDSGVGKEEEQGEEEEEEESGTFLENFPMLNMLVRRVSSLALWDDDEEQGEVENGYDYERDHMKNKGAAVVARDAAATRYERTAPGYAPADYCSGIVLHVFLDSPQDLPHGAHASVSDTNCFPHYRTPAKQGPFLGVPVSSLASASASATVAVPAGFQLPPPPTVPLTAPPTDAFPPPPPLSSVLSSQITASPPPLSGISLPITLPPVRDACSIQETPHDNSTGMLQLKQGLSDPRVPPPHLALSTATPSPPVIPPALHIPPHLTPPSIPLNLLPSHIAISRIGSLDALPPAPASSPSTPSHQRYLRPPPTASASTAAQGAGPAFYRVPSAATPHIDGANKIAEPAGGISLIGEGNIRKGTVYIKDSDASKSQTGMNSFFSADTAGSTKTGAGNDRGPSACIRMLPNAPLPMMDRAWVLALARRLAQKQAVSVNLWAVTSFEHDRSIGLVALEALVSLTGGRMYRTVLGRNPSKERCRLSEQLRRCVLSRRASRCLLRLRGSPMLDFCIENDRFSGPSTSGRDGGGVRPVVMGGGVRGVGESGISGGINTDCGLTGGAYTDEENYPGICYISSCVPDSTVGLRIRYNSKYDHVMQRLGEAGAEDEVYRVRKAGGQQDVRIREKLGKVVVQMAFSYEVLEEEPVGLSEERSVLAADRNIDQDTDNNRGGNTESYDDTGMCSNAVEVKNEEQSFYLERVMRYFQLLPSGAQSSDWSDYSTAQPPLTQYPGANQHHLQHHLDQQEQQGGRKGRNVQSTVFNAAQKGKLSQRGASTKASNYRYPDPSRRLVCAKYLRIFTIAIDCSDSSARVVDSIAVGSLMSCLAREAFQHLVRCPVAPMHAALPSFPSSSDVGSSGDTATNTEMTSSRFYDRLALRISTVTSPTTRLAELHSAMKLHVMSVRVVLGGCLETLSAVAAVVCEQHQESTAYVSSSSPSGRKITRELLGELMRRDQLVISVVRSTFSVLDLLWYHLSVSVDIEEEGKDVEKSGLLGVSAGLLGTGVRGSQHRVMTASALRDEIVDAACTLCSVDPASLSRVFTPVLIALPLRTNREIMGIEKQEREGEKVKDEYGDDEVEETVHHLPLSVRSVVTAGPKSPLFLLDAGFRLVLYHSGGTFLFPTAAPPAGSAEHSLSKIEDVDVHSIDDASSISKKSSLAAHLQNSTLIEGPADALEARRSSLLDLKEDPRPAHAEKHSIPSSNGNEVSTLRVDIADEKDAGGEIVEEVRYMEGDRRGDDSIGVRTYISEPLHRSLNSLTTEAPAPPSNPEQGSSSCIKARDNQSSARGIESADSCAVEEASKLSSAETKGMPPTAASLESTGKVKSPGTIMETNHRDNATHGPQRNASTTAISSNSGSSRISDCSLQRRVRGDVFCAELARRLECCAIVPRVEVAEFGTSSASAFFSVHLCEDRHSLSGVLSLVEFQEVLIEMLLSE